MVPVRRFAQEGRRQHRREQRREVHEDARPLRPRALHAGAPAAIRHHRGADADEKHRRDQRPAEFEVRGRQRPFACGQRARPCEAEHQLRHQERGPVPAHGRRLVRARQQPAVDGPRDGAQDHVEVARHQPQPEQLPPFAAAEHQQHARHRQQRAADLAAADARAEEEGAHREHPQRQARADQRHVDGRGGLQRQVLEGVVQADTQQAEHRVAFPVRPQRAVAPQHLRRQRQQQREGDDPAHEVQRQRRDQLPHHAADHGIAGPQQRRNEEQEDGEGSEALRLCLHGRRLYRAMIPRAVAGSSNMAGCLPYLQSLPYLLSRAWRPQR